MPGKTDISRLNCSVAGALSIVGDWWSLLIVRDGLLGVQRFGEFQQSLGLAKNILSDRLSRLVEDGIFSREGTRRRPLYRLTDKGRALTPVVIALMQWGDHWVFSGQAPVIVTDPMGREVDQIELRSGEDRLSFADLSFGPGEGATADTRAFLEAMRSRSRRL